MTHWCSEPYPVNPYVKPGTCRGCGYVGHVTKYGRMRPHLSRSPEGLRYRVGIGADLDMPLVRSGAFTVHDDTEPTS